VCLPQHRVRKSSHETTEKRPFDIVNDEKQKEKRVADQFFRGLLEAPANIWGVSLVPEDWNDGDSK
jgi:hypothetical protein